MAEIFFNPKLNEYTLKTEIDGVKSVKRVPIKFRKEDSTSRFRKELLKDQINS